MPSGLKLAISSDETTSILQADSTTQGVLVPRMTTAQRDAIASPATGLLIFNTDDSQHEEYTGATWQALGGGGGSSVSITSGPYGSLPASGTNSGDSYYCNDSLYTFVWDGSSGSWAPYFGTFPVTAPLSSGWSWDNQGGATLDTSLGYHSINEGGQPNVVNYRIRYRAAPSVPYVLTTLVSMTLGPTNYHAAGIGWRQSSDGKLNLFRQLWNGSWRITSVKCSDSSTDVADYISSTCDFYLGHPYVFLRLEDDNTNRICSYSMDGINWMAFYTVGRTDYLTADELCFWVSARGGQGIGGANYDAGITLISWEET